MKKPAAPRPRVGREALLRAAAEVFFEQGYAAASIDAVIGRAGGSKRNIYNEFGSKEGLFTALVAQNVEQVLSVLSIEDPGAGDLRGTLLHFGQRLLQTYMSPAVLGIYRIVVTESARFPDLVLKFYEQGPGLASAKLAERLEAAHDRGDIQVGDCAQAADHFVGMVRGNLHLRVALGLRPPPPADEIRRVVRSAVDIFLDGVRARPSPAN